MLNVLEKPQPTEAPPTPWNVPAEQAVIGAVLMNGPAYIQARAILQPADFFLLRHTHIWEAFERLYQANLNIDYLTVCDALRRTGQLAEVENGAYLTQLVYNTPTAAYVRVYAELVKTAALRVALMQVGDRIRAAAQDETHPLETALDKARVELNAITQAVEFDSSKPLVEVMGTHLENLEHILIKRRSEPHFTLGVPTGIHELDQLTNGFLPGDITTIAGVTGTGKSALILSLVVNACRRGQKVALFSGELTMKTTLDRLIGNAGGIDVERLAGGYIDRGEHVQYARTFEAMKTWTLNIWDNTRTGVGSLEAWLRRLREMDQCDILFVDGYNELDNYRSNREKRWDYADIMNSLEAMATHLELPVVGTHQLNRGAYRAEPNLDNLSEAASIEHKSARVYMLWWENGAKLDEQGRLPAKLKVAKNRHGSAVGKSVDLWFFARHTRYEGQRQAPPRKRPELLPKTEGKHAAADPSRKEAPALPQNPGKDATR